MKVITSIRKLLNYKKVTSSTLLFIFLRVISYLYLKYDRRLFTFKLSSKLPYFDGYPISERSKNRLRRVALVLQGPLNRFDKEIAFDFARSVKDELGFCSVIYSGPDWNLMTGFCDLSLEPTIRNKNINQYTLQQSSTLTGLYSAQQLGAEFIVKLRADSILTRRDAVLSLIEKYESASNIKVVVVSHQKPYYYPFLSDHLMFGHIDDLIKLWEADWNGQLDLKCLGFSNDTAKSPEWILGHNFIEIFPNGKISIATDSEIGYCFLKYDYFDPDRFDYESVPHFGKKHPIPSHESSIGGTEDKLVKHFGGGVYERSLSMPIASNVEQ